MQNQKSQNVWKYIFFTALGIFVLGVVILCFYFVDMYSNKPEQTNKISSKVVLKDNPIDFDELQKQNTDIYAWIKIPNTRIDYPILQSAEDDAFYLNHNADKEYTRYGAIYTEMKNKTDFTDPNTVVYGHNMRNGTMFRDLHKFREAEFFSQNKYIYVYTRGHILTYEICAAYRYDNRHILNSFNFSDPKIFAEYIEFVKNPKSIIVQKREVEMDTNSKILTLSTCISNDNYRYLVQGVLVKDEATK